MIIKILSSSSQDFHGVRYNEKKVDNGIGEIMTLKNFPLFINKESHLEDVRNYLKSISKNSKIKKPQFHAVISTKYQEHSKHELVEIAEKFMDKMGYGQQPYLIIFHNDTDNNHVHIVSSRVDKFTGKKINDSFEKLQSQKILNNILEKRTTIKTEKDLSFFLKYNYSSTKQLELLLQREGFKLITSKTENRELKILKNGVRQAILQTSDLNFQATNIQRKKQLRAIFYKYKNQYSNKVFRVVDNRKQNGKEDEKPNKKAEIKIDFESELQYQFRKLFGLDIVFHNKDNKDPFGYTVIDHKTQSIFKGSEIMKMKDLFEITNHQIDRKRFEKLKEFNISNDKEKRCLKRYLGEDVTEFMIFKNKTRKRLEDYKNIKKDVIDFINKKEDNKYISVLKSDNGDYYAIHSKYNHIQELQSLIGKEIYNKYLNPNNNKDSIEYNRDNSESVTDILDDFMREFAKSEFTKIDPAEKERLKKKRKQKKR